MSRFIHDPTLFDLDNDDHDNIFGECGGRASPASSKSKGSSGEGENEERILSADEFAALGSTSVSLNVSSDLPSPTSVKSGEGSQYSISSEASTSSSRSRYLYPKIDTVESLRPEEVRWFYKEIGEKKWTPFIGYDSLRIECKHRELQHRVIVSDAKFVPDLSETENPIGSGDSSPDDCSEIEHDPERINVRGGLYEVDVTRKECYPIYWSATSGKTELKPLITVND